MEGRVLRRRQRHSLRKSDCSRWVTKSLSGIPQGCAVFLPNGEGTRYLLTFLRSAAWSVRCSARNSVRHAQQIRSECCAPLCGCCVERTERTYLATTAQPSSTFPYRYEVKS